MSKKRKKRQKPRTPEGGKELLQTESTPSRKKFLMMHWRQMVAIVLLASGMYVQTWSFGYVLDDSILITENKFTQEGISGVPDIFRYESFRGHFGDKGEMVEGGRYRPLSIATFAAEKSITGGSSSISHLINLVLYALTGLLLYRVILMMFPAKESSASLSWFTLPLAATLLFIVHPLHVEVVANVKGRDEILALLAELGILYFTFRWMADKKIRYLLYSFLCFYLGILSKENVITFLAVVPITLYFFKKPGRGDYIRTSLPLWIATLLYLLVRVKALGYLYTGAEITNLMNNPFYGMAIGEKTATIFYTLLLYLKLLIYPHPLTHDYYPYHISIMTWSDWAPLLSLLLYGMLIVFMIRGWKGKSVISYSIAFFLVTLSIVSNLVISVGTFMNERFVYHASLGFCIATGWLLTEKMKGKRFLQIAGKLILLVLIAGYSLLTLKRIPDWKNGDALERAAIKVSPGSARANLFYGIGIWNNVYLKLPAGTDAVRRKAVLDSIKPYFENAVRILPSYKSANAMLAGMAGEYHKLDHDYKKLIGIFEEVNLTGTYEKFILDYLHYLNPRVSNLADAQMLEAFYERMLPYYETNFGNTNLPDEYRSLLKEIRERMPALH